MSTRISLTRSDQMKQELKTLCGMRFVSYDILEEAEKDLLSKIEEESRKSEAEQ